MRDKNEMTLDFAAINKHHVPGTAYHWRHGYIPLDLQTAEHWHKHVLGTKEYARLEPGWVKHTTDASDLEAIHAGDYMSLKTGETEHRHRQQPIGLTGSKFKTKKLVDEKGKKTTKTGTKYVPAKFQPYAKPKATPLPKSSPFAKQPPKTLTEPMTKVHIPGNAGGQAIVQSYDPEKGQAKVIFASGPNRGKGVQTVAGNLLKKYDPTLDYSHLPEFRDTAKEHHGENNSLLVTNKAGEVIPKPTGTRRPTGYTKTEHDERLTELPSIKSYTGSGYRAINNSLRKGEETPAARKIHSDLAKTALPGGLSLYRGLSSKQLTAQIVAAGPGAITSDKGFSSTSRSYGSAFGGQLRYHITTTPGLRGAGVENVSAVGPGEREVLLDKDTVFVTQRIRRAANGQLVADVVAYNPEDVKGIESAVKKAKRNAK